MKRNIAIIAEDQAYAQGLTAYFDQERYNPYIVLVDRPCWTALLSDGARTVVDKNDFSFFTDDSWIKFDFAYVASGAYGSGGKLQGYFDLQNIPYSSSNLLVSAISFNKFACNQYLKGFGVRVPEGLVLKKGYEISSDDIADKIGFPCIVKPNEGSNSSAVMKVDGENKIWHAITDAFKYSDEVLIEPFVKGMEVECACYKTQKSEGVFLSVSLPEDLERRIKMLTSVIYDILGCSGFVSVNYIVDIDNKINLLRINATPQITADGFICRQIMAAGRDMKEVMTDIIENKFV